MHQTFESFGDFHFFFFSQQFEKSNLVWTTVMASVNCYVLLSLESVATDTTTSHDHITITLNLDTALEVEPHSFLWKLISGAQHQNYLNRSTKPRREQHKKNTPRSPLISRPATCRTQRHIQMFDTWVEPTCRGDKQLFLTRLSSAAGFFHERGWKPHAADLYTIQESSYWASISKTSLSGALR